MAHRHTVIRSINAPGETRCVDILRTRDGDCGWQEFRRDPEDGRGWHPVGAPARFGFATPDAALDAALSDVAWLRDALSGI